MAPNLNRPRLVAVDTNVALDFAQRVDDVMDAIETLKRRLPGVELWLPPTVVGELAHAASSSPDPAVRNASRLMLRQHRAWGFRLINFVPLGFDRVEQIARRLRQQGLLPEAEIHDSLVVAEAAALHCALLTSSDQHVHGINHQQLAMELEAFDLVAPLIATPREIVRNFFR
jgi:predicted nucleic acid-binding protein